MLMKKYISNVWIWANKWTLNNETKNNIKENNETVIY